MKNKGNIKWARVLGIVLIPVVIIGGIVIYQQTNQDPYAQYIVNDQEAKKAGTNKQEIKDEETYYLSVNYPVFDNSVLDKAINDYREQNIKPDLKQNSKIIISVDYDSKEIYNSYINVNFHQKLMDENGKVLKQEDTSINYDKTVDKIMNVDDVLRRDYLSLLKTLAKDSQIDEKAIAKKALQNFIIQDDQVSFYLNHDAKKTIQIPYEEHKEYIALTNKNIPSLYQNDPIVPAKEEAIDPEKPMVAFTFDDGPSDLTMKLMDAFDKAGAKATFFMVGPNVKARPDVVAEMYRRGFELGNHTWSHEVELTRLNKKQLYDEIYKTQDAIFAACGKDAAFLRAPYGTYNDDVLKASSMTHAFWSTDTEDWKNRNTDTVKNKIMESLFDGAIILEHDLYGTSVEAAIEILPELKAKGYQIVTLSTLLKYKGDMLVKANYLTESLYQ